MKTVLNALYHIAETQKNMQFHIFSYFCMQHIKKATSHNCYQKSCIISRSKK